MDGSIARPGPGGPRLLRPDRPAVTDPSPAAADAPEPAVGADPGTTRRDLLWLAGLALLLRLPTFFAVKHLTFDDGVFGASAVAMRNGGVPFRDVYIHALVRDKHGDKMSKTKGNVVDPLEVIDRFGADAFRFTLVAFAAQGRDVLWDEKRVEGYQRFTTKIWQALRYAFLHAEGYDPAGHALSPSQACWPDQLKR